MELNYENLNFSSEYYTISKYIHLKLVYSSRCYFIHSINKILNSYCSTITIPDRKQEIHETKNNSNEQNDEQILV